MYKNHMKPSLPFIDHSLCIYYITLRNFGQCHNAEDCGNTENVIVEELLYIILSNLDTAQPTLNP